MVTNSVEYQRNYRRARKLMNPELRKNRMRDDIVDYVYQEMLKKKPYVFQRYKVQQELDRGYTEL